MEWAEDAFVLVARRHGESDAVASVLTRGHGRCAGLVRGGAGRRAGPVFQPGNRIAARWRARLDDQLGTLTAELVHGHAARLMADPDRLATLVAAAAVADAMRWASATSPTRCRRSWAARCPTCATG
jgi:DNA repair protein RecO (recombination protein O)